MKNFVVGAFVSILLAFLADGCRPPEDPIEPGTLELRDNVHIVSTTGLTLEASASDLTNGVYVFKHFGSTTPDLQTGDILVSGEGDGYIRKVTSVTVNDNTYTISTTQGTLEDVYKSGNLIFNVDLNFISPGKGSGLYDTVVERTLFKDGILDVTLRNATLRYAPNFVFFLNFDSTGLQSFDMKTGNSNYVSSALVRVRATAQVQSFTPRVDTLRKYVKQYVKWGLVSGKPTPIVVRVDVSWISELRNIEVATTDTNNFSHNTIGRQSFGAHYDNGWQSSYNFNPTSTISTSQRPGTEDVRLELVLRPVLAFKIMGVPGPFVKVSTIDSITSHLNTGTGDWDIDGSLWQETSLEINSTILGKNIPNFEEKKWETSKKVYTAPHAIEKVSGDNQRAFENQSLRDSVKVKVTDSNGQPVPGVPVRFSVTTGSGSASPTVMRTNSGGLAQSNWKVGTRVPPVQTLEASAKRADLSEINNSPIQFTAFIDTPVSCQTMLDRELNAYPSVVIGGHCWTTINLKTTQLSDGTSILQKQDSAGWLSEGQNQNPVWCNYFGDPNYSTAENHGRIYNWHAVNTGKLCPSGWHVATLAEYEQMFAALGGEAIAGRLMKLDVVSEDTWEIPLDANNISGFTAISSGRRDFTVGTVDGFSTDGLVYAYFWARDSYNTTLAHVIRLRNQISAVNKPQLDKTRGYSVRCVKD